VNVHCNSQYVLFPFICRIHELIIKAQFELIFIWWSGHVLTCKGTKGCVRRQLRILEPGMMWNQALLVLSLYAEWVPSWSPSVPLHYHCHCHRHHPKNMSLDERSHPILASIGLWPFKVVGWCIPLPDFSPS
jgi:hypothetical protein